MLKFQFHNVKLYTQNGKYVREYTSTYQKRKFDTFPVFAQFKTSPQFCYAIDTEVATKYEVAKCTSGCYLVMSTTLEGIPDEV